MKKGVKSKKIIELEKILGPIEVMPKRLYPYEDHNYAEQYFPLFKFFNIKEQKPLISKIHESEWHAFTSHIEYNKYTKNVIVKKLEKCLEHFSSTPGKTKLEFLNHVISMFKTHPDYLDFDSKMIVREWLSSHLILIYNYNEPISDSIKPSKFAIDNWSEIKELISHHDGIVMAAVKEFCADNMPIKEIQSITKAVSRLCKAKGIQHNRRYPLDK